MATKATDKGLIDEAGGSSFTIEVPTTLAGTVAISGATTVTGVMTVNGGLVSTAVAKASGSALTVGGVYTLSGANGGVACGVALPTATGQAGATYIFRSLSIDANFIEAGTGALVGSISEGVGTNGTKCALEAAVGSSVVLTCDGLTYNVAAKSGSLTIS